jgi:hypothetical protein
MMDRLLVLLLVGMLAVPSYGAVENFQELIDNSAAEQFVVLKKLKSSTDPQPEGLRHQVPGSDFKIKLVRRNWRKRTYVASKQARPTKKLKTVASTFSDR